MCRAFGGVECLLRMCGAKQVCYFWFKCPSSVGCLLARTNYRRASILGRGACEHAPYETLLELTTSK